MNVCMDGAWEELKIVDECPVSLYHAQHQGNVSIAGANSIRILRCS